MEYGKLYIVATPIGNLGDITLRALDTLKQVDFIAAEDTRRTVKLLNHYEIKKKLISFHEYSNEVRVTEIVEQIKNGASVALVSDAGTPVISDPGYVLIKQCAEEGIVVESLPGACAGIAAVTLSGIDCRRFLFVGFLVPKQAARKKELQKIVDAGVAAVIYESPNRVIKTLADICDVMGEDMSVCVAREITKVYEEVQRTTAGQALLDFSARESIKGEFVIVTGIPKEAAELTDEQVMMELDRCVGDGMTKKEAVTFVTANLLIPKNKVYKLLIQKPEN